MKVSLTNKKTSCLAAVVGAVLIFFVSSGNVLANEQQVRVTVETYLSGLLNGDVAKLKSLVTPGFAGRLRHMDSNPDRYGEFLKSRYAGAAMNIVEIIGDAIPYKVRVSVVAPGGEQDYYTFLVEEVDGVWLIAGEE